MRSREGKKLYYRYFSSDCQKEQPGRGVDLGERFRSIILQDARLLFYFRGKRKLGQRWERNQEGC